MSQLNGIISEIVGDSSQISEQADHQSKVSMDVCININSLSETSANNQNQITEVEENALEIDKQCSNLSSFKAQFIKQD